MSTPEISVVIPVYDEASLVRDAARELGRKLDALGWDYEIVLAENGSRDGTPDVLREIARSDPRVRWFHEEQPNYGRALKRGILEARGRVVICDEIDLCDVGFYQRALPLIAEGADLVVGSKAMRGAGRRAPLDPARRDADDQRPVAPHHRVPRHRHPRPQGVRATAPRAGGPRPARWSGTSSPASSSSARSAADATSARSPSRCGRSVPRRSSCSAACRGS